MTEDKDKKLEKLDEINLLWILRQISVGNIMRGFDYLFRGISELAQCITGACGCPIKSDVETEEDDEPLPEKSERKKKKSKKLNRS